MNVLQGLADKPTPGTKEADRLLRLVLTGREPASEQAQIDLLALGEDGLAAIFKYAAVGRARMVVRTAIPFNLTTCVGGGGGGALVASALSRLLHLSQFATNVMIVLAMLVGLCAAAAVFGPRIIYPRDERRFIRLLAAVDDVRAIPGLLVVGTSYMPDAHPVEGALIRLLPKLRDGDPIILNSHELRALQVMACRPIQGATERVDLACAALDVLPLFESKTSIPMVKLLLMLKTPFSQDPRIRAEATRCLARLEETAGIIRAPEPETLLRASSANAADPSELVRAASAGTESADQLLRATSESDDIELEPKTVLIRNSDPSSVDSIDPMRLNIGS